MSEPIIDGTTASPARRPFWGRVGGWLCRLRSGIACTGWLLVALGLLLRFTVRDRFHPLALVYYVTPIPALPVWMVLAALIWPRRKGRIKTKLRVRITSAYVLVTLVFIGWAFATQSVSRAKADSHATVRCVFWNVARAPFGVERVGTQLRQWDLPVIALVEADKNYKLSLADWQAELPGYQIAKTHFGGLVAVKGAILSQQEYRLSAGLDGWTDRFEFRVQDQQFTLLLVDIASRLSMSRRTPLATLANLAETLDDRPLVIMGDFNTPDDSLWFAPLQQYCRLAFREAGQGYAATWPVPLPVLTLDQVWVNQHVEIESCHHGWTTISDHRPVFTSLSLNESR